MSSTLPTSSKSPALTSTTEPKPRGANRSTKVAGKLKVLPEQPQSSVTSRDKPTVAPIAPKSPSEFESPGTTADSDEDVSLLDYVFHLFAGEAADINATVLSVVFVDDGFAHGSGEYRKTRFFN